MIEPHYIGVDIGGGSIKTGLISREGAVLATSSLSVNPNQTSGEMVEAIIDEVKALCPDAPAGIGIGFPGTIRPCHGIGDNSNVPALDGVRLADMLSERFSCDARLENDATAAGLAEATFGEYRDTARLLVVTLGTGIGVSFFVDRQPLRIFGGCLGDLGHTFVTFENAVRCRIGCLGCLESVASGAALSLKAASCPPGSAVAKRAGGRVATAADVIGCALDGDHDAKLMLAKLGCWVGRAAAGWCQTFGPDVVLIGGGLSSAGEHILAPMRAEAVRIAMPAYRKHLNFQPARLGNQAGMIGAATQMFATHAKKRDMTHV